MPDVNRPSQINDTAAEILEAYQQRIMESVPGFLDGVYVYGSVALHDYIPKQSDIDFVAISAQRANTQQFRQLVNVHRQIGRAFPRSKLSGIYVCWDDLGKSRKQIHPYPYCSNNRMRKQGYFELNEVTWWQLRKKSICIFGEQDRNFDFNISETSLKKSVTLNMQNYWKPWVKRHSHRWSYQNWSLACFPRLVEWGALTVSRQFYTLSTGDVTSKTAGGFYCLEQFPKKYHAFLSEVIDIRKSEDIGFCSVSLRRSKAAIDYMSFVFSECERRHLFNY